MQCRDEVLAGESPPPEPKPSIPSIHYLPSAHRARCSLFSLMSNTPTKDRLSNHGANTGYLVQNQDGWEGGL
jgi:hypothetical protein